MKIGIMGLGNIAQKAYLPFLITHYPEIDWHLCTRNEEKLEEVGKKYSVSHLHTTLEELIEDKVDAVFVHTPTFTHEEVIRTLLENQIHVYVDKPVSESLEETKHLYQLAEEKERHLVAGFNRRFAPMVQKAKQIKNKNMLIVQKNRVDARGNESKYMLYDLFIHPLDTALYLLDGEVRVQSSAIVEEKGKLLRAWVMLETDTTSCLVSMNCQAGANEETIEIHSPEGTTMIKNLTDYETKKENKTEKLAFGDWENTLRKRGFEPIAEAFIESINNGKQNPVSKESSLLSHQICEEMLELKG